MIIEKIKIFLRWGFGIFCAIGAIVYTPISIPTFICWTLLAALLIPPIEKLIIKKIPFKISTLAKVIAGIVLLIGIGLTAPKTQVPEQQIKTETKTQKQINVSAVPSLTPIIKSDFYLVTSVIDGDTIQVVVNGKKETIRLIGIDSPETVDPRKPVQCFGKEASAKLKSLISGKQVALEADQSQGDRDKYQRLLRYIFVENNTNINKVMLSEGYAYEYTYNLPYKYQSDFKKAQKDAEKNKKGLWADNACSTSASQSTTAPQPTTIYVPPVTTNSSGNDGSYACGSKTTCGQMASCAEANYYLNTCGVSRLDGDSDGVPCESLCN